MGNACTCSVGAAQASIISHYNMARRFYLVRCPEHHCSFINLLSGTVASLKLRAIIILVIYNTAPSLVAPNKA